MSSQANRLDSHQSSGAATGDVTLPIYLDNHATTPLDPRVLDEMLPYMRERFGNPASRSHSFGWEADKAIELARRRVAGLIDASPREIVFTSGATESDNLAIKGLAYASRDKGDHIVTVTTEHKAVLDSCKRLEKEGFRVTYLDVEEDGVIDFAALEHAIEKRTILVSVMAANNETGVLQPIAEIGSMCHERGIAFHTDAAQAAGKIPLNVNEQGLDLVSISGHKMYGPKGVGALYVRAKNPEVRLAPIIDGGGHENGMRSGTLNVPGIVGLGKACEICQQEMEEEAQRTARLRDRLRDRIVADLERVRLNGSMEHRLPGNLNMSFEGVDGEALLTALNGIALSSGAACTSAHVEPSYVLKALKLSDELAQSSLRFGVGRFTTEAEVDYVAARVIDVVRQLRELSDI